MPEGGTTNVLIRCRNEEQWIGHTIQSVIDCIPDAKVYVIDNNSTDESISVVRQFLAGKNKVKELALYKYTNTYSPGAVLNKAIGDMDPKDNVLILSAHCVLYPTTVVPTWSLDSYCVVWGKQVPIYRGKRINPRYMWLNFGDETKVDYFSELEGRYFIHNALALYRVKTLQEFPFDEKLQGKEDRYWAANMISEGYHTLYNPNLICYHHWTPNGATWKGLA